MLKALVLLAVVLASPWASATSFDCRKASTDAEKTICGSALLGKLDDAEVIDFVHHRLLAAGRDRDAFTPEALSRIVRCAEGIPRLVNLLCGKAQMVAQLAGTSPIVTANVDEAAADLQISSHTEATPTTPDREALGRVQATLPNRAFAAGQCRRLAHNPHNGPGCSEPRSV